LLQTFGISRFGHVLIAVPPPLAQPFCQRTRRGYSSNFRHDSTVTTGRGLHAHAASWCRRGGISLTGSTRVGMLPWCLLPDHGPSATSAHNNGREYQHDDRNNPPDTSRQQELNTMGPQCLGSPRSGDAATTVLHFGGPTHNGLPGPKGEHNFLSRSQETPPLLSRTSHLPSRWRTSQSCTNLQHHRRESGSLPRKCESSRSEGIFSIYTSGHQLGISQSC